MKVIVFVQDFVNDADHDYDCDNPFVNIINMNNFTKEQRKKLMAAKKAQK